MDIIKDYIFHFLQIVFVWPVAFLVFIFIFKKQITKFIDEIAEFDWGGKKITRKNSQKSPPSEISKLENNLEKDFREWDYKKLYLDLFLTPNSLSALKWFYLNPGKYSISDFTEKFALLASTNRADNEEKGIIVVALRENDLITNKNNYYEISEEGIEYLKYRKII